jgi:autotransporter-associated beta strand protein
MSTSVMTATHRTAAVVVAVLAAGLCQCDVLAQSALELTRVATGLTNPLYATHAPGDPQRLFVVEKTGAIKILNLASGTVSATPFMTAAVTSAGIGLTTDSERGLLGLAFHPNYQSNGRFFINSTDSAGTTRIREFRRLTADQVDSTSARDVLSITQPYSNHNGGWLDFGRDGHLYIAMGDGGSSNDPHNYSQDRSSLLGKMLRLDVSGDDFPTDATRNYRVPATNPFVGQAGMRGEIWAYGLRNPWRNSFDRATGDLYMGDVGQSAREEINFQPAASAGGENYGWRVREGTISTGLTGQSGTPLVAPIYDYVRGSGTFQGLSVTGGYVYRGPVAALDGQYFFGDYVRGRLFSLVFNGTTPGAFNGTNFTSRTDWTASTTTTAGTIGNISSFGEDAAGNVYLVSYGGSVFRIGLPALSWSVAGTGTWSAAATNWTTGSGSAAAWNAQRRAVFTPTQAVVRLTGDVSVGLGLEFRGAQARLEGVGGRVILAGTTSALNQIDVIAGGTATVAVPLVAAAGLLKTGAGALVLTGSGGPAGPTTIRGGAVVVAHETALASGTVRIESGGTVRVAPGLSASLGGLRLAGGTLDVSNGRVSLRAGSYDPVAIQAGLQSGRGGGDWRGPAGVTSTAVAAADGPAPRGVGWLAESDGAMVLAYAAPGDTNLDWQVDLLDTANFLAAGQFDSSSLATWSEGDFTYDGLVDILDAADFLSTGLYDAGGYNGSGAAGVAAVPEPAVWVITAVVPALVAGAAARRRACRSRR